jgi:hypothetical protein
MRTAVVEIGNTFMIEQFLPYRKVKPPAALRRARMDNLALVPASLLPKKGKYQTIANNLPKGGILICQTDKKQRIGRILARVARYFADNGHFARTLPYSVHPH